MTSSESSSKVPLRSVVLAAVDASSAAERVTEQAARMAVGMHAVLHLVQVVDVVPAALSVGVMPMEVPSLARLIRQSWDQLERLLGRVEHHGIEGVGHVAVGEPVRKILQLAADLSADALVVGTHDPGNFERLMFGSVASALMLKAPCPVMVVREKRAAHPAVPEILPPCPECVVAREASHGQELWCERHRQHHPSLHTYHEVPEPFALGSLMFRP